MTAALQDLRCPLCLAAVVCSVCGRTLTREESSATHMPGVDGIAHLDCYEAARAKQLEARHGE